MSKPSRIHDYFVHSFPSQLGILLDGSSIAGIILSSPDGKIFYCNKYIQKHLGQYGQLAHLRDILSEKGLEEISKKKIIKSILGHNLFLSWSVEIIHDSQNNLLGLLHLVRKVSDFPIRTKDYEDEQKNISSLAIDLMIKDMPVETCFLSASHHIEAKSDSFKELFNEDRGAHIVNHNQTNDSFLQLIATSEHRKYLELCSILLSGKKSQEEGEFSIFHRNKNSYKTYLLRLKARFESSIFKGYILNILSTPRILGERQTTLSDLEKNKLAPATSDQIDWEHFYSISAHDQELALYIAMVFLESAPIHLQKIKEAIAELRGIDASRAAHKYKGSLRNFGAKSLVQLAQNLEDLGETGDLSSAHLILETIEKLHFDLILELNEFVMGYKKTA